MPRPRNEKLPQMLLDAARELLVKHGTPTFSLRELSQHVGYTLTAVYRCFDNRAALLRALQLELFEELNAHTRPSMSLPPQDAIRSSGRMFVQWAIDHRAEYLFMFSSYDDAALLSDDDAAIAQGNMHLLAQYLEFHKNQGTLHVDDPAAAAVVLITNLHGVVSLSLTGRLNRTPGENLLEFFDAHLEPQLSHIFRSTK